MNAIPVTIRGGPAVVHLAGGLHALVDRDYWTSINRHRWCGVKLKHTTYAYTNGVRTKDFQAPGFYMHQMVMPSAKKVDHWDGDGLHNWRNNLRECTHGQNSANTKKRKDGRSKFKGVHRDAKGRWKAQCRHKHLGVFDSEEDAARAYDDAAKREFGEFAKLNFPEGQTCTR